MKVRAGALALLVSGAVSAAGDPGATEDLSGVPMQSATVAGDRGQSAGATHLEAARASEQAGAHNDALVAAQALPGIARPPLGSGALILWGAAPRETLLLVDGMPVPALTHANGASAVLPDDLVSGLTLAPASPDPRYGRSPGGVLSVDTHLDAAHALRLAMSPLDAQASAHTTLGPAQVALAGRRSLLEYLLTPALSSTARELFPLPHSWDAQLLASLPLGAHETLALTILASSDAQRRTLDASDSALSRGDSRTLRFGRVGLRYTNLHDDGRETRVLVHAGDDFSGTSVFAGGATSAQRSWSQSAGLRASQRSPLGSSLSLTLGAELLAARAHLQRNGALTTPSREGDLFAFGQTPGASAASDDWTVAEVDAALFASLPFTLGALALDPGLRLVAHASDTSLLAPHPLATADVGSSQLEWFAEPRLSASWRLAPRARLLGSAGLQHQPADPADRSALFGAPTLTSSTTWNTALGLHLRAHDHLALEATAYLRALSDLATRSASAAPAPAQLLTQDGTGRAFGLQLVASLAGVADWTAELTALLSRSERVDHPGAGARPFDFDAPVSVQAQASWVPGPWTLGARLRVSSGYPRTEVIGATFDSRTGAYDPLFGAHNGERLPVFVDLSLRAARTLAWSGGKLSIFLEAQNVLGRPNADEFAYNRDWSQRVALSGLPPLALLGLEAFL
ncbi:MAG: hypothetical protein JST92_11115 [Deltaproteobacteria bacterium]|nr:hypothetical protein [Deltaproteobacteria bacterium]